MAKAISDMSILPIPQIVRGEGNVLFYSESDNMNKIITNVHESNVINTAKAK